MVSSFGRHDVGVDASGPAGVLASLDTAASRKGGAPRLAGVVAQRLVDELERARDLVADEPVGEVGAQLVRGELAGRLHQRMDPLAEIVVGDADHHRRQHLRVGVEGRLDLGGIDVGAARRG